MISCNSTFCLFTWIFISAKSQGNMLSCNSTQTQTTVNNQVNDHRQKPFSTFFDMNWFSMTFQIDFFRKIIVTILLCLLTSCPHKNDWHVSPKCLFYKNLNHKLGNCVTYYLNEQILDAFATHFFENKHDHRQRSFSTILYELVQYDLPN